MNKNTYTKDGINLSTFNLLFDDHFENDPSDEAASLNVIEYFTMGSITINEKTSSYLSRIQYDFDSSQYNYKYNNIDVRFNLLSNYLNVSSYKNELLSEKRYGNCHGRSSSLALTIKDSKVLTGFVNIGKSKFLHSVVEIEMNDQAVYCDWTKNLIMPKEDYLRLTNLQVVESITEKDVLNDYNELESLNFNLKLYLTFRDELIKWKENNEELFIPKKIK